MNPISMEKTGTLQKYIEKAEEYLDSREALLKSSRTAQETAGSMETGKTICLPQRSRRNGNQVHDVVESGAGAA